MRDTLLPAGSVVVVGLRSEAALLPKGTRIVVSGGEVVRLGAMLAKLGPDVTGVLSFGIAGGLAAGLPSGTLVAARQVLYGGRSFVADEAWLDLLIQRTGARRADIAASDTALTSAVAKSLLHGRTGAIAVDMESGIAARIAAEHGVPFAALRAIADRAEDAIPKAALCGLNPDGSVAPHRVLAALMRRPQDLPGLIRLGRASALAHAALRQALT